jgi:hypothetical protein
MIRRLFALLVFAAFAFPASAQTFAEYLKLRKAAGVSQPVGIPALEAFIGKRTLEVKGLVKGTFSVGGRHVILLERADQQTINVQTDKIPDWLIGNEVQARILIRAERDGEYGELRAWLIGAAAESEMSNYEAQLAAKAPKPPKALKATAKPANVSAQEWSLSAREAVYEYAARIKQINKRLPDAEAMRIATGVIGFSQMYGVDARLIMAMVMAESGFNPGATSSAGAMGLGQLMPGTARGLGVTNAYDSIQNLYGTVRVIRGHLERYGKKTLDDFHSLILSLAAYNAGSGAVRRHGGVPPYRETQNYIRKVISYYNAFRGIKG